MKKQIKVTEITVEGCRSCPMLRLSMEYDWCQAKNMESKPDWSHLVDCEEIRINGIDPECPLIGGVIVIKKEST
jgi:hypothetical protein